MNASYKFIQKLWILNQKILEKIKSDDAKTEDKNLDEFTNQLIEKATTVSYYLEYVLSIDVFKN